MHSVAFGRVLREYPVGVRVNIVFIGFAGRPAIVPSLRNLGLSKINCFPIKHGQYAGIMYKTC